MWPIALLVMEGVSHSRATDAGGEKPKQLFLTSVRIPLAEGPHLETVLTVYVAADEFVLGFCWNEADGERSGGDQQKHQQLVSTTVAFEEMFAKAKRGDAH